MSPNVFNHCIWESLAPQRGSIAGPTLTRPPIKVSIPFNEHLSSSTSSVCNEAFVPWACVEHVQTFLMNSRSIPMTYYFSSDLWVAVTILSSFCTCTVKTRVFKHQKSSRKSESNGRLSEPFIRTGLSVSDESDISSSIPDIWPTPYFCFDFDNQFDHSPPEASDLGFSAQWDVLLSLENISSWLTSCLCYFSYEIVFAVSVILFVTSRATVVPFIQSPG